MPSRVSEGGDNFDSLRFLFATCVAVFHFVVLTGAPSLAFLTSPLSLGADVSVSGFFVLSGYLVLGSFQRSKSVVSYAEKRFRRLYPAYATVIVLSAFLALLVSGPARDDLGAVAKYLGANLIFLNFLAPTLPGLFEDNRLQAVNGALWTLKIEVAFYCLLPLIALIAVKLRAAKWIMFAALYLAAEVWRGAFRGADGGLAVMAHQLPGQMSYFVTGMALWEARDFLRKMFWAACLGLTMLIASYQIPAFEWSRAAALGILVIAIARAPSVSLNLGRDGDFSYGIYILHFPIIQIVAASAGGMPVWIQAAIAGTLTFIAAVLLWRFVERPLLHPGSHYKRLDSAPLGPRTGIAVASRVRGSGKH